MTSLRATEKRSKCRPGHGAGLAPFAVGLTVFALAVVYLVSNGLALGTWLFAAFLLGHGLIQLVFLLPRPAVTPAVLGSDWPFDMADSWTIGRFDSAPTTLRRVGRALIVVIVAGFTLAALATVGWIVPASWWLRLSSARRWHPSRCWHCSSAPA